MSVIWLSVVTKIWGKVAVLLNRKKNPPASNINAVKTVKTKNIKLDKPATLH